MPIDHKTTAEAAEQITRKDLQWGSLGGPVTVSYGFRPADFGGLSPFTANQIDGATLALQLWSDVSNITFTHVGAGNTGPGAYTNSATMLFGNYIANDGAGANGRYPGSTAFDSFDGDVNVNLFQQSANLNPVPGTQPFQTLVHEIGHAIGLAHPGDYNAGLGVTITYDADAEYVEDTFQFSAMSYFGAGNIPGVNHGGVYPSAPMLHDIAAAQLLYGWNTTTRTGDTVYGFNSNADRDVYKLTSPSQDFVVAIYDAGGNDTLDFSGYSVEQIINLQPGSFSSPGSLTKNLALAEIPNNQPVAPGFADAFLIENAIGGSGRDYISGNYADNPLVGGASNDTIFGLDGDDVLMGGAGIYDSVFGGHGNDLIVISGLEAQLDVMDGGPGTDTLQVTGLVAASLRGFDTTVNQIEYWQGNGLGVNGTNIDDVFNLSGLTQIFGLTFIDSKNGNDKLTGSQFADDLRGGFGNDILNGGQGNDKLSGGGGNDKLNGEAGDDKLNGGDGNDYLIGNSGNNTLDGGAGEDVLLGASDNDIFVVREIEGLNDVMFGGGGVDTLEAHSVGALGVTLAGFDSFANGISIWSGDGGGVFGGPSGDYFDLSGLTAVSGLAYLSGAGGNDTLIGSDFDDDLRGGDGFDDLRGGDGNDRLNVTGNSDTYDQLDGGTGADRLVVLGLLPVSLNKFDAAAMSIEEFQGNNNAVLGTGIGDSFDFSGLTSATGILYVDAQGGDDVLIGWDGVDSLVGGNGADFLFGGLGNDYLKGGSGNDQVLGGGGDDTLIGEDSNDKLDGGTGNDFMNGGDGNDSLDGGTGNDSMIGGNGSDTYFVDSPGDIVTEEGGGTDIVNSTVNYTLGNNVENLVLVAASGATIGTGNGLYNAITGNGNANTLSGLQGNDTLDGLAGNDSLLGGQGNDKLIGGVGNDVLTGGAGNDSVLGGRGDDTIVAGGGDATGDILLGGESQEVAGDRLLVDGNTDIVLKRFDSGINEIENWQGNSHALLGTGAGDWFDFSYLLSVTDLAYIDGLGGNDIIIGHTDANYLRGGDGNDTLTGSGGGDTLIGGNDHDKLYGGGGDDTLFGGSGNDSLDGGAGSDSMVGGNGRDSYFVDSAGDIVVEAPGGGTDQVSASIDYTLTAEVESLLLTESPHALYGTGNDLSNLIAGNSFDNVLTGMGGHDTLRGFAGQDTLLGMDGNDSLDGGVGNDQLYGGANNDRLTGGADDDTLDGGAGNDTLTGGGGNDTYVHGTVSGEDVVSDFNAASEAVDLNAYGFTSADQPLAFAAQVGADVKFTFAAGDALTLKNTLLADLDGSNFLIGFIP